MAVRLLKCTVGETSFSRFAVEKSDGLTFSTSCLRIPCGDLNESSMNISIQKLCFYRAVDKKLPNKTILHPFNALSNSRTENFPGPDRYRVRIYICDNGEYASEYPLTLNWQLFLTLCWYDLWPPYSSLSKMTLLEQTVNNHTLHILRLKLRKT